jgi:hypothetical protein
MSHRRRRARGLVASLLCLVLLPGQAVLATAQESASATYLSAEDAIQFAVKWAKFGERPDANVLVDTAIGVMSVGFPPAGAALAVAWGFIKAMSAGPDPVFEALQALNARLDAHERFIVGLQNDLNAFRNHVFEKWDTDRLAALHRNLREVKSRTIELRMRPTDRVMKRRLVEDAKNLAAEFLPLQEGVLPEAWKWSDIPMHIEKGEVTLGRRLAPEFKVLPTFDYYVNALVLLMAAIEYESGGNAAYVRKTHAADLVSHARFLSVRPLWGELDRPETLPEHVMARVACRVQPVTKYPRDLTCRASYHCQDLMRRTAAWVDSTEYRVDSDRQLCTYGPPARPPTEQEQARRAEELDRNPRYGSSAMSLWRQWGQWALPRVHGQEDLIEDAYGVGAMAGLADKLVNLLAYGTVKEPETGQFDFTFYRRNYLYALKPNGELLWYSHLLGIDRNPPKIPYGAKLTGPAARGGEGPGSLTRQGQGAAAPGIAARSGRFADAPGLAGRLGGATKGEPATPSGDAAGQASPLGAGARAREDAHQPQPRPGPRITHQWEGPRLVATGWQGFREVIPAGSSGFYGLTPDGTLKWYRHDGALDGTGKWKGPVDVGKGGAFDPRTGSAGPRGISGGASAGGGWSSCRKIVAAGDGVLYCIGPDGTLRWYRHGDAADTAARPTWYGPSVVGTGWGSFAHVFSAGEGTLYGVTPTGDVLWYRHRGYLTGQNIWEGPKPVHAGWVNLRRVFSPGAGVIFALRPDGALLWYEHEGYRDGKAGWLGPIQVAADWGAFVQVFPRMTGTPIVPR